MKNKKSYVYIGLPVLGMIFYLAYIRRSAIDMVYSDYIRLINSYLRHCGPDHGHPRIWTLRPGHRPVQQEKGTLPGLVRGDDDRYVQP